jgi:hypothetical protein
MKIRTCQLLSDGLNCASLPLGVESEGNYNIGTWRSLVARFAGGEEVAGSNPVVPTNLKNGITSGGSVFFVSGRQDENEVRAHDIVPCITAIIQSEMRRSISASPHRVSGANSILWSRLA